MTTTDIEREETTGARSTDVCRGSVRSGVDAVVNRVGEASSGTRQLGRLGVDVQAVREEPREHGGGGDDTDSRGGRPRVTGPAGRRDVSPGVALPPPAPDRSR